MVSAGGGLGVGGGTRGTLGGAKGRIFDGTLGSGTGGLIARPIMAATLAKAFRMGGPKERGVAAAVADLG